MAWKYFCSDDDITLWATSKDELADKLMDHVSEQHGMRLTREQAMDKVNENAQMTGGETRAYAGSPTLARRETGQEWTYFCTDDDIDIHARSKEELADKFIDHLRTVHDMMITREQALEHVENSASRKAA